MCRFRWFHLFWPLKASPTVIGECARSPASLLQRRSRYSTPLPTQSNRYKYIDINKPCLYWKSLSYGSTLDVDCRSSGYLFDWSSFYCVVGFAFILKTVHDKDMAELVGGGVLMYQNVSLGVCQKAVNWIKEKEVIFGMDQSQLILKKLIRFFNRGLINGWYDWSYLR